MSPILGQRGHVKTEVNLWYLAEVFLDGEKLHIKILQ